MTVSPGSFGMRDGVSVDRDTRAGGLRLGRAKVEVPADLVVPAARGRVQRDSLGWCVLPAEEGEGQGPRGSTRTPPRANPRSSSPLGLFPGSKPRRPPVGHTPQPHQVARPRVAPVSEAAGRVEPSSVPELTTAVDGEQQREVAHRTVRPAHVEEEVPRPVRVIPERARARPRVGFGAVRHGHGEDPVLDAAGERGGVEPVSLLVRVRRLLEGDLAVPRARWIPPFAGAAALAGLLFATTPPDLPPAPTAPPASPAVAGRIFSMQPAIVRLPAATVLRIDPGAKGVPVRFEGIPIGPGQPMPRPPSHARPGFRHRSVLVPVH